MCKMPTRRPGATAPQCAGRMALFFWWEVFFVDGGDNDVVGVDHFGEVQLANFRKELVRVEFGEAVVAVDPLDEFGDGNADGVVDRTVDAGGHEFAIVFEARPVGAFPFY